MAVPNFTSRPAGFRAGLLGLVLAIIAAVAGEGCSNVYEHPPVSPLISSLPQTISEAGLYSDPGLRTVSDDMHPFTPAYELWSDGSAKRRWIRLPPNRQIDTTDMDAWGFPLGTELWKEFSVDGRRVETRLLTRLLTGPDGWVGVSYVWNEAQSEAIAQPAGVIDALGTTHDVPSAGGCMTCHGGRSHRVLGYSAIQLSHAPTSPDELTLGRLVERGLLSHPPTSPIRVPGTTIESNALGYLHANCGSCHNSRRPKGARYFEPFPGLDLWLQVESLSSVAATTTYQTMFSEHVVPGMPQDSRIYKCMAGTREEGRRMPPIGTEILDVAGMKLIESWIAGLEAPVPAVERGRE